MVPAVGIFFLLESKYHVQTGIVGLVSDEKSKIYPCEINVGLNVSLFVIYT